MEIQNTKAFQKFIEVQEIFPEQENSIQQIIEAFSEYLVAVNPDYIYNKTYLNAYIDDFIKTQKVLKQKHRKLKEISIKLNNIGLEKETIVKIDDTWTLENGNISLSNTFDQHIVQKEAIQLEIKSTDYDIVVAKRISFHDNFENKLDDCISNFIEKIREVNENND